MSARRSLIALTAVCLLWPASIGSAQSDAGTELHMSSDGLVTLEVPPGARPEGAEVGVEFRGPDAMPVEISELPAPGPHIEVSPIDAAFGEPVRITREIPLDRISADPLGDVPLAVLAIRHADGTWQWLDDAMWHHDADRESVYLSGLTDRGGHVFAFILGETSFFVVGEDSFAPTENSEAAVGVRHIASTGVEVSGGSAALVAEQEGRVNDDSVAVPSRVTRAKFLGSFSVDHYFECLAPGETTFEAPLEVTDLGDDNPATGELGLPGTSLRMRATGLLVCLE